MQNIEKRSCKTQRYAWQNRNGLLTELGNVEVSDTTGVAVGNAAG